MYAKVFRSMWDGTLAERWEGWVVLVFLMAHADPEGLVDMTPGAIARRSGLPLEVVRAGIDALEEPDPMSRSPREEGRRLVRLDPARTWGWRIVNYREYRGLVDAESMRQQTRERVQRHRERNAEQRGVTLGNAPLRQAEAEAEAEAEETQNTPASCAEPALELGAEAMPEAIAEARRPGARSRARAGADKALERDAEARPLVRLPTNVPGVEYPVGPLMVAEWQRLYPAVNVETELRRMRGWLLARPRRRKTWGGTFTFATNWLDGEQNKGGHSEPARGGSRRGSDQRYMEANAGALKGDGTDG